MWDAIAGFALGAALAFAASATRYTVRGLSSSAVQRGVYVDRNTGRRYRLVPVVHVCPPTVDVDQLEHSEDSETTPDADAP